MTPDDYTGYEQDKINSNPKLELAWSISQILDDNAPINWWKHKSLATCLLANYKIEKKS